MHPKQGTDAAVAMAMGHVILKEFYFGERGRPAYFEDYARRYTDLPLLIRLKRQQLPDGRTALVPERYVRASDFDGHLGQDSNPEWKTVAYGEDGGVALPNGSIGFRWGEAGRADEGLWNLESKEARTGNDVQLKLSVLDGQGVDSEVADVAFPYFGGLQSPGFDANEQGTDVLLRRVPSRAWCWTARRPSWPPCSTCWRATTASTAVWKARALMAAMTPMRPTPRPGRKRSPACRVTR